ELGGHRIADRDGQAQRREPARLARRYSDEARQPLARIPHRRADALGLRQRQPLIHQRADGAPLTDVAPEPGIAVAEPKSRRREAKARATGCKPEIATDGEVEAAPDAV